MENKKSILKEAILEHDEIMKAAKLNAQEKLAKEFPEKFKSFLKEELNKNEEVKSVEDEKKVDVVEPKESENTEETEMVDEKADHGKPFEEKAKEPEKVKEDVNEERDKDFMGDLEADTPNKEEDEKTKKGIAFTKETDASSGKPMANLEEGKKGSKNKINENSKTEMNTDKKDADKAKINENEDFNIDELDLDLDVDGGLSIDEIELEIDRMEKLANDAEIQEMSGEERHGDLEISEEEIQAALQEFEGDDENFEDFVEKTTDDAPEADVDEGHGITRARRRGVDGKLPRVNQGLPTSHERQLRFAMRENKSLTKKLNEFRKKDKVMGGLVENYKTALQKYRDQLNEMAVFNTNLAHVNNLLVNESISLTQKDRVRIINEFKNVQTISKSKETYKSLLNEMAGQKKKNINEKIETKFSSSIQPSSKNKLDEVVEKKVYENNDHINKIKRLIEYTENRGKKRIT